MPRQRATTYCQGCCRRATRQHAGCTCPTCGGVKNHGARQCRQCAGQLLPVVSHERECTRWRLACLLCSRETEVLLLSGRVPPPVRCGRDGSLVLAESVGWRVLMEMAA